MIGVSCTDFCTRPVEYWVDRIAGRFRLWEIFSEVDHSVYRDTQSMKEVLDRHGLACQVHAPICDWNIAAMSDRLREASLRETSATIDAAEELGARMVTVHPGLSSLAVGGTEERAVARAKESVRALDGLVRGRDLTVAIENMPSVQYFLGRTAEQLADIVDGTDMGICFDIGHANTTGQIDAMIDTFGDRIANIHIHDNHGTKDEHLTIGDGEIDFAHVIGRLSGYRGNWIIESRSFESAVASSRRLEGMLPRSGPRLGTPPRSSGGARSPPPAEPSPACHSPSEPSS